MSTQRLIDADSRHGTMEHENWLSFDGDDGHEGTLPEQRDRWPFSIRIHCTMHVDDGQVIGRLPGGPGVFG